MLAGRFSEQTKRSDVPMQLLHMVLPNTSALPGH
jgi:hypothetical protein